MRETQTIIKKTAEPPALERPAPNGFPPNAGSYGYGYGNQEAEQGLQLKDFLVSIRKHLWLVVGLPLLATFIVAAWNARTPDYYEAHSQVLIGNPQNQAARALRDRAIVIRDTADVDYLPTQMQLLASPLLVRRVVKRLDLEHNPQFLAKSNVPVIQGLKNLIGLRQKPVLKPVTNAPSSLPADPVVPVPVEDTSDAEEMRRLDPSVRAVIAGLKISQVRDTRLLNINFTHTDPNLAALVANTLAEEFRDSNQQRNETAIDKEGEFLLQRIAEIQQEIRAAEQRLVEYTRNTDMVGVAGPENTTVARLTALNAQLIDAQNRRIEAETKYRTAQEKQVQQAQQINATQEQQTELDKLRRERERLLVIYTPEWGRVKEIDQEIAAIENQMKQRGTSTSFVNLTTLEADYKQALQKENQLRAAFDRARGETRQFNETAINYNIINQEVETKKKILNDLLDRQNKNRVEQAGTQNNITLQERSLTPAAPAGPKRFQTILMAFLISLAFAVGLARMLDYLDTTVRTAQDIERHLRMPVLALIPASSSWKRLKVAASSSALQRRGEIPIEGEELLTKLDARAPLAEVYRQLRTSILLSTAGRAPKSLLVTSSQASEGKTTNAVNIAYTLTQTGAKVLIIDADMRRPRLHSIFQTGNHHGLSNILSSEMSEAEILNYIVHDTALDIYVLPSGPTPPNPAELLSSEAMRRTLSVLEKVFTHIVVDSPPLTVVTDSVILGSMVDGVILVVQGDRTTRDYVRRAQRLLQEVGARIFGVVLNNVNVQPEDYYYYQGYYKSRYYESEAATTTTTN